MSSSIAIFYIAFYHAFGVCAISVWHNALPIKLEWEREILSNQRGQKIDFPRILEARFLTQRKSQKFFNASRFKMYNLANSQRIECKTRICAVAILRALRDLRKALSIIST